MAQRKNDNKMLLSVFDGIVAVYKKDLLKEKINGVEVDVMSMQIRWGSSYGWIKEAISKNITQLKKFEVNDIIHIKRSLTNVFSRYYKNNLLVINNLIEIDKVGQLDRAYHKK
ncbi:hypothetical protein [Spiroplasma endosymbiont of Ammophila pubescens]|uniref:hypothetical protein n=2 Tax=Spiroplasma endosymbiont of Ammophila pubescens TaxID=3066315 RepID=UPI0032B13AB1